MKNTSQPTNYFLTLGKTKNVFETTYQPKNVGFTTLAPRTWTLVQVQSPNMSLGAASGMPPLCTGPSSPALDDEQASLVRNKVTHGDTSLHFNLRLLPWEGPRPFQMPPRRLHSHCVDLVLLAEPRAGWGWTCNSLATLQLPNRTPEFPGACSSSPRKTCNVVKCNYILLA